MFRTWRDFAPAALLTMFVVFAFLETYNFRVVPAAFAQGMQASAMPRLVLGLILFMTIIMAVIGYGETEPDREAISWKVWATKAVLIAAALSLELIGATLTIFWVALLVPLLWGERRYGIVALYALVTPCAIYALFTIVLRLRLPQGPLEAFI